VASTVATPKYLSPLPNCSSAVFSSVALEDLRVELDRLADHLAVAGPVLIAEHMHERAVVDPVHPQGPHEIAFEEPEGLSQQQRARHLGGDTIDDLAPELGRHPGIELAPRDRVLGA
jgi:hypothetical protein